MLSEEMLKEGVSPKSDTGCMGKHTHDVAIGKGVKDSCTSAVDVVASNTPAVARGRRMHHLHRSSGCLEIGTSL